MRFILAILLFLLSVESANADTYLLTLPTISAGGEDDSAMFTAQFSIRVRHVPGQCRVLRGSDLSSRLRRRTRSRLRLGGMEFWISWGDRPGTCVSGPDLGCASLVLVYADPQHDLITYTLIEPDSFWATIGQSQFDLNTETPPDGTGARIILPGGVEAPCNACFMDHTPTPEPRLLVVMLVGMLAAIVTRCYTRSSH